MLRKFAIVFAILSVVIVAAFWLITAPQTVSASVLPAHVANIENGKVMFHAGGCNVCHGTKDDEAGTRLAGGIALPSPFGTFYAPNISSDPNDGIGGWTEAEFVTAMMKGTSPAGRHYYPAFPYTSYQRMALADVRDLFAYLKMLPPVPGKVRDHDLSFPFNLRFAIGGWKLLYLDGKPFRNDPAQSAQSAQWNRGAYLVNGPSHCAECHSPRNLFGAIIEGQRFAGGPSPDGKGTIPNITQLTIGGWSEAEIVEFLETGQTPDDKVSGDMAAVVRNTARLPPEDRAAMAVYIKSLPPVEGPKQPEK